MKKVLITEFMHPVLTEGLIQRGYACETAAGISEEDLRKIIGQYEGVIVSTRLRIDQKTIDKGVQLFFIARAGSGMERIDVAYAEKKGIICLNSPEGNSNSVGEHAIGLLLAMYHNITRSFLETSHEEWNVEANRVHELEGKTIAIIGYGNTGKSFSRKLKPFGMHVFAYDKYLQDYGDEFAEQREMDDIFAHADVISFHIPLTEETKWLVDEAYLQRFQKHVHLINTSRGRIIRHSDVLKSIHMGRITGAAFDVYENEDFLSHTGEERNTFLELIKTGKVIFTPHIAGKSYESGKRIAEVLVKKISQLK